MNELELKTLLFLMQQGCYIMRIGDEWKRYTPDGKERGVICDQAYTYLLDYELIADGCITQKGLCLLANPGSVAKIVDDWKAV